MFTLKITDRTDTSKLTSAFYDEIFNLAFNGIEIEVVGDNDGTVPMPWDAGIEVKPGDKNVTVAGGAGPSGFGSCVVEIPRHYFHSYYNLSINPRDDEPDSDGNSTERLLAILESVAGFSIEEAE